MEYIKLLTSEIYVAFIRWKKVKVGFVFHFLINNLIVYSEISSMWLNHVYFTDESLKTVMYLPNIISTKPSLLYFSRNIRWLSALISTSYGRNPACISPSAFFKSWTPHHQKPWSRSIWSWSTSCGFQISSFITSRPLRLVGAIKEFWNFNAT